MPIDPKKIDELKAQHGDNLYLLEACGFEAVFRGPTPELWKKLRAEAANQATELIADQNFVVGCLLHPGHPQLSEQASRTPAIYQRFSRELGRIAGATAEVSVKKL